MIGNFAYIESGIILNIKTQQDFKRINYTAKDFSVHGNAFSFMFEHFDKYREFPTFELLFKQFPEIDLKARELNLDYCLAEFQKQVLFRNSVKTIKANQELLKEDPEKAIQNILSGLNNINLVRDTDISIYDNGELKRYEKYLKRKELRNKGLKILGIPTGIKTLDRSGIGWLPGELTAIFARPEVGKTWFGLRCAAIALQHGKRTLFVSTEMPKEQIELRLDVIIAHLNNYTLSHFDLRYGNPIDEEQYKDFLNSIKNRQLFTCDSIEESALTIQAIQTKIRQYRPQLVILDGIHLFSPSKHVIAIWEKMFDLLYSTKRLCITTNVPCILTTQANRKAADTFFPPKIQEVAFGDALMQASDIVFTMWKDKENDDQRLLQIQKYRDGPKPKQTIRFHWNVDIGDMYEIDPEDSIIEQKDEEI